VDLQASPASALALDRDQHCLYATHGQHGTTHFTRISLVNVESRTTIALKSGVCTCIAVQQEHMNAGLVAVAGRLGVAFVQVSYPRGDVFVVLPV
jgi:hypothetical protein